MYVSSNWTLLSLTIQSFTLVYCLTAGCLSCEHDNHHHCPPSITLYITSSEAPYLPNLWCTICCSEEAGASLSLISGTFVELKTTSMSRRLCSISYYYLSIVSTVSSTVLYTCPLTHPRTHPLIKKR